MSDEANDGKQPAAPAPAPVQEQPAAAQQQVPAQPGQPVQYVMTQKSLNGVDGWLIGWIIYMACMAISAISIFFGTLASQNQASDVPSGLALFFMPLIALSAIGSIVFIAQKKLLGKYFSLAEIGLVCLYAVIQVFSTDIDDAAIMASAFCIVVLIFGLQAWYFFQSERVKQTLVK